MSRKPLLVLAVAMVAGGLAIPASASAQSTVPYVVVTPTPAKAKKPGGMVKFTINVNESTVVAGGGYCFDCIGGALETLVDSVYGDLNGRGTCAVSPSSPQSIPYVCEFTARVGGPPGSSQTNTVTGGWVSGHTGGPFPPDPNFYVRGTATGSATVPVRCKKGYKRKTIEKKSGKRVKKCVKKKNK